MPWIWVACEPHAVPANVSQHALEIIVAEHDEQRVTLLRFQGEFEAEYRVRDARMWWPSELASEVDGEVDGRYFELRRFISGHYDVFAFERTAT